MAERKYYEAYDERYKTAHERGVRWMGDKPSSIVSEVLTRYGISRKQPLLELGCGEGRDAVLLLEKGYDLLATDVSPEAIGYCRELCPAYAERFQVLDCVNGSLSGQYAFIYAVAVLHMLVPDEDRDGFYRFLYDHLTENGLALICTMGDGEGERQSDISTAFEIQPREHRGGTLQVAGTSCRMVSFATLAKELSRNCLAPVEQGVTEIPGEFPEIMYAVVSREKKRPQKKDPRQQ